MVSVIKPEDADTLLTIFGRALRNSDNMKANLVLTMKIDRLLKEQKEPGQIVFFNLAPTTKNVSNSNWFLCANEFTSESLKNLASIVSLTSGQSKCLNKSKQSPLELLMQIALDNNSKILYVLNTET